MLLETDAIETPVGVFRVVCYRSKHLSCSYSCSLLALMIVGRCDTLCREPRALTCAAGSCLIVGLYYLLVKDARKRGDCEWKPLSPHPYAVRPPIRPSLLSFPACFVCAALEYIYGQVLRV